MPAPIYTTSNGRPITYATASQTLGPTGPVLLQDFHLIDLLAHFDRERIPERVVHSKGAGAFGDFEVTHDITDVCSADLFSEIGMNVLPGNWDMVGNNTPIFFIRDGVKFPTFIHTQKRNPQTKLKDATMFWDFLSSNQESVHQTMYLFTDRGTPHSYRYQNTYSAHTFKFTKLDGSWNYVKLHFISHQGEKNMTNEEAAKIASLSLDWHAEDLFNATQHGQYPSWTLFIQVLSPKEAENFRWNIFDVTKVWPHSEVPMRPVGKLTLNRNAENYFAEIEQLAFAPAHLVPGIEPSGDPMLQARLFSYADSQRHRLGVKYQQIPVNRPLHPCPASQRDGFMTVTGNGGSAPNYPSPIRPYEYKAVDIHEEQTHELWSGRAVHNLESVSDEDYVQANILWEMLGRKTNNRQDHLVHNIASHLFAAGNLVRERSYEMFSRVNVELGRRTPAATEAVKHARGGE